MSGLSISIVNGWLGRQALNTDNWGGLYVKVDALPSGWVENEVKEILKVEDVAAYGFVATATNQYYKLLYWHISEAFRVAKLRGVDAKLFVQISVTYTPATICAAFKTKDDRIRHLAFVIPTVTIDATVAGTLNDAIEALWTSSYMGVRGIASFKKHVSDTMPDFSAADNNRLLVDVSNDLTTGGIAKAIFDGALGMCGAAGTILGQILGMSVHQKPSWKAKPINSDGRWVELGDINGDSVEALTESEKTATYGAKGLCIICRQLKLQDAFIYNSRMATATTDDYANINNGRVIDKASYFAYLGLVTYLDAPVYADPATGKIAPEDIEKLQMAAWNSINNNMVVGRTGDKVEVSVDLNTGSLPLDSVYINPNQNFLTTDTIAVDIRIVPVGSAESIETTIGLTVKVGG